MFVRCAWCGCEMPANNAEPREETSRGMCVECLAVNFPDEHEHMNATINGPTGLAMDVEDWDLGAWPTVAVWCAVALLVVFASLLYWRLAW